ncbi:Uma2 family endonuclease [Paraburkholderia sp. UCT31]|uniref:Uma2 family endonuclease n=1 Tax=Paraburkholderia sp. UCT31 TaxID=2615209 RepID=UPI001656167B|nr:Uma2 family endonuclease [Paraburkholderia sp. UCT31]MBC8738549.1 Uma2 family endonuclease [Paraburkholderia sp. UCT31]
MHVEDRLAPSELLARWRALQDGELEIKDDYYELNERGEIVVTPRPTLFHQAYGGYVASQLFAQLGDLVVSEASVLTLAGILVPDVVWMPLERWEGLSREDPLAFAPDVCVEILSKSNTTLDIARKTKAYLDGGAKEVILVGMDGQISYWGHDGESKSSRLGLTLNISPTLLPRS